jgi:hypothetical protein
MGRTGAIDAKKMRFLGMSFQIRYCGKRDKNFFLNSDFYFRLQAQMIEKNKEY